MDDYYNTLGVSENASADEIKKAYRGLSLKYHPDRTQGDVEKAKLFQKINEAYETLGDPEKRQQYNMQKNNPFMRMNSFGGNGEPNINMNDIFQSMFFGGMPGGMPGMFNTNFPQGSNVRVFMNGVPINLSQTMQKPQPITKIIQINMEMVLNGAKVPLDIERWYVENGNQIHETVKIYVDIFRGIDHNEVITIAEQGNKINDSCKGDINIYVQVKNETNFSRRGLDLIMEKDITLKEALCGFSFDVKYINGKMYTINNLSGSLITPEYQKIIQNMGLTRDQHTGNLIIIFHVKFPDSLTKEQIEELKKIL
jgi:DnaJ-class molecular chaperone